MSTPKCFVHPEREGPHTKKVPCAPDGKLYLCEECARPENGAEVFALYKAQHGGRIADFKASASQAEWKVWRMNDGEEKTS